MASLARRVVGEQAQAAEAQAHSPRPLAQRSWQTPCSLIDTTWVAGKGDDQSDAPPPLSPGPPTSVPLTPLTLSGSPTREPRLEGVKEVKGWDGNFLAASGTQRRGDRSC